MATKTTYTSTITAPVYASWGCEKCGEVNFATGSIIYRHKETTSSWRPSVHAEAKERASICARTEWAESVFNIIDDPTQNGAAMYNDFFLQNTKCTKCGQKPRWNKNAKFLPLVILSIPASVISGIIVFYTLTSIAAWLVFLASVGFFAWGTIREMVYKKMLSKLPKQYTPVIGSLNPELIRYAKELGKTIPSPDECIATVIVNNQKTNAFTNNVKPVRSTVNNASFSSNSGVQSMFCRKCGTQLQKGSVFCRKCGTEIVNR